jgi:hypothetical protein
MFSVRIQRILVSILFLGFLGITFLEAQAGDPRSRYASYEKYAPIPTPDDLPSGSGRPEYIPPPREPAPRAMAEAPCWEDDCNIDCEMPSCSPPGRFWFRADYLMWFTSGTELPPLVVAGPANTPADQIEVVYGDSTVLTGGRSAVRLTLGGWLDRCHRWGVEADWTYLSGMSSHFEQYTTPSTLVNRPLYDLEKNKLSYELADWVKVDAEDYFDSMGAWFRYNLCCSECCGADCGESCEPSCGSCGGDGCGSCGEPMCGDPCGLYYCRTDLLLGYRYYTLGDSLTIHEALTEGTPSVHFDITDSFRTRNDFHGAEVGISTQLRRGRWGLDILAKMAVGNSRQTAYISGFTQQTTSEGVFNYNNGIYATLPNMGTYTRDQFTIIPQLNLELSRQLTCRLRAFVGYSILYWGSIWRAGDQVDLFIDPRNWAPLPQTGRLPLPTFPGQYTNFWAQGINVGMEWRF